MADFEFPLQIKRQFDGPLDFHDVLTTVNRTAWLTDARRYAGQVVYDSDTTKLYILNSAKNAWLQVPTSTSSSEIDFTVGNLTIDNVNINGNTISTSTGNLTLAPNGASDVLVDADTLRVGDSGDTAFITSNGTGDLTLNTNSGTNSSSVTVHQGVGGNIDLILNGTGKVGVGTSNPSASHLLTVIGGISGTNLDIDNIDIDGNTISSTNTNGNINITPNADGDILLDSQKWPRSIGSDNQVLTVTNATNSQLGWVTPGGGSSGIGDVSFNSGLGAPTDNALVKFDSTTGKIIQKTDVLVDDSNNITGINNFTINGTITLPSTGANLIFAGPDGSSGAPRFRLLVANDIPNLAASKITSGTLTIARGGTNSTTALNNGRVMISNGGAIVESTITTTELGYLDNVTSDIQSQINGSTDIFQLNENNINPFVFNDTVSGSSAFSIVLSSNSTYQVSYSLLGEFISTPGTVLSSNNTFDFIDYGNTYLKNVNFVDLPVTSSSLNGTSLEALRYLIPKIIVTKSSPTTVVVGFTGSHINAFNTLLSAGSYIRFQRIK